MKEHNRSAFSGSIGFILAAAGSAVGLGNIWRFPYLAAKNGGGLFLVVYIILALTFGFALLTTEIAIGRKTKQGPLTAYSQVKKGWGFLGIFAALVPSIILPYYCAIGGWIVKYMVVFITQGSEVPATDGYFGGFITTDVEPVIWMLIFLGLSAIIIFSGVEKGIENYSKIIMPALFILVIGISIFCLTISNTGEDGVTRTGLDGLMIYIIPDISGMTLSDIIVVVLDAMGQLFFSISVAMGIMVAYGSYVRPEVNLSKSVNQIELFDTLVAVLAGLMIVPAVFVFFGKEGMSAGPGLMFITLPKVFAQMGTIGRIIGILFFVMVLFAAVTSNVSIMEAIVSSIMDKFKTSRKKAGIVTTLWAAVIGLIVCLGYTNLYFDFTLPNGSVGQILDIMDYLSNSIFMPLLALLTCILIGWIVKPKYIIDEVTNNGQYKFNRAGLYKVMMKFVAPVMLFVLLLQAFGII